MQACQPFKVKTCNPKHKVFCSRIPYLQHSRIPKFRELLTSHIIVKALPKISTYSATMKTLPKKTVLGKVITYSSIGIQVGLTVGLGMIAGVYLDRWLGTGPWLTVLGLVVGVISGFTRLFQIGKEFSQK